MWFFKKKVREISPAKIQLQLGQSPSLSQKDNSRSYSRSSQNKDKPKKSTISPLNKGELKRSYSISPQKRREQKKPFTSHDIRESINKYYNSTHLKNPEIDLKTQIKLFTKRFTRALENKINPKPTPVYFNFGVSPTKKNNMSHGGKSKNSKLKIITKPTKSNHVMSK
jgi:hypothetical protein